MSVLKPVNKRPRPTAQPQQSALTRTESIGVIPSTPDMLAESALPTTSLPTSTTTTKALPTHPKGHKVHTTKEIWETMDKQSFLHLTDTLTLSDVWVMPLSCEAGRGSIVTVKLLQVLLAPHIKKREAECKMSTDDLLKMLYLCDAMQERLQIGDCTPFEEWLNDKTADCVKVKGADEGTNRAILCNFIMNEDRKFTFYPTFLKGNVGIFFRKICYHSYKDEKEEGMKLDNPSIMKCCATKGKFEYVIESKLVPLPANWFNTIPSEAEMASLI